MPVTVAPWFTATHKTAIDPVALLVPTRTVQAGDIFLIVVGSDNSSATEPSIVSANPKVTGVRLEPAVSLGTSGAASSSSGAATIVSALYYRFNEGYQGQTEGTIASDGTIAISLSWNVAAKVYVGLIISGAHATTPFTMHYAGASTTSPGDLTLANGDVVIPVGDAFINVAGVEGTSAVLYGYGGNGSPTKTALASLGTSGQGAASNVQFAADLWSAVSQQATLTTLTLTSAGSDFSFLGIKIHAAQPTGILLAATGSIPAISAAVGTPSRVAAAPTWQAQGQVPAVTTASGSPVALVAPSVVPLNLTATARSDGGVDLAWDPVAGVQGYDVERDGVVIAADVLTAAHLDPAAGLDRGVEYTYRVRSVL